MKFLGVLGLGALALTATAASPDKVWMYIGTYTSGPSKGIYRYELSLENGSIRDMGLAGEAQNPSFVAIHPNKKFLYAASEVSSYDGKKAGAVIAFKIDPDSGKLTKLNDASSGGDGPCYVVVDAAGKNVLVANYGGGSVAVLPIKKDGSLGEATAFIQHTGSSVNAQRQKEPHAHSINLDAANRFAFVADLGLDKIMIYRFDADKGTLAPNEPAFTKVAPGGGPRHFAFRPNGKNAYVCNEITSTVTAFNYDSSKGTLTEIQTIPTLPEEVKGNSTAEMQVHPSGKFAYCSNRGHNSVAVYSIGADGKLTHVENESTRGKTPRNFGIDPSGKYLIAANQDSDTLAVFRIDPFTGALEPVGEPIQAPKPVCVKFLVP
jgi:6-phosphogluconolactonase